MLSPIRSSTLDAAGEGAGEGAGEASQVQVLAPRAAGCGQPLQQRRP